jgi:hypothetical protein
MGRLRLVVAASLAEIISSRGAFPRLFFSGGDVAGVAPDGRSRSAG